MQLYGTYLNHLLKQEITKSEKKWTIKALAQQLLNGQIVDKREMSNLIQRMRYFLNQMVLREELEITKIIEKNNVKNYYAKR